ncbi:helix-turn-helix domain-containing protein (plasmid) [Rhizobium leguminosarum]
MTETITPSQIRAGRALLAWSQQDLAREARVAASTVADFERGQRTPIVNNFEAMRTALEVAGITFFGGGAILESAMGGLPSVLSSGHPIRWVEASDLDDWGDRRDGQAGMPELISRLILASFGNAVALRFPSAESVQYAGWDGICEVPVGTPFVPAGFSAWEIGVQRQGMTTKANEDYEKRSNKPGAIHQASTTFVFATLRRWPGGSEWAEERRKDGIWKDIQVLDADDLVHWLELYPAVSHWLMTRMGRRPSEVRTLSGVWTEWSLATEIPLTADLTLAGRDEEAAVVLRWLRASHALISVQAESVDEATAFLHAAINELPQAYAETYLARMLVPDSSEAARLLGESTSSLILVLGGADPGLAQALTAKGHHVYLALGSDAGYMPSQVLKLSRPRRSQIEQGLHTMGFEDHEASRLAADSGQSLTVIRRLIPAAPGRLPAWANPPVAMPLLAALLAGGWNEEVEGDRAILEELSGIPYHEFARELAPFATALDGPLRKSELVWKVASPRDLWFLLAANLSRAEAECFARAFARVLGAPDPRYHLPGSERWMAAIKNVHPPYSGLLRRGLTESSILMALFADRAVLIPNIDEIPRRVISALFEGADTERWWNLQSDFQRLAEAAPEVFLDALEAAIDSTPSPLQGLFQEDDDRFHGGHYLSDLLWALERLAWDARLLGRVAAVLAGLAALDPGGRMANRPENSLRQIFLLWSPQTNATLDERLRVIDRMRQRAPAQAWKLLVALAPNSHGISMRTSRTRWRELSSEAPEVITYGLMAKATEAVLTRLLDDAGNDGARWCTLVETQANFDEALRQSIRDRLIDAIPKIADLKQRLELRNALRKFLYHHRQFLDAEWALSVSELAQVQAAYDQLEPEDMVTRVAWLFDRQVTPPNPPSRDWQEGERFVDGLRIRAIGDLLKGGLLDPILKLAKSSEIGGWIGKAVEESTASRVLKDQLLRITVCSDDEREANVGHGMVAKGDQQRGSNWTKSLLQRAQNEQWGDRALLRILHAMPSNRQTWDAGEAAGIANEYWRTRGAIWIDGDSEDIAFAAEQFLAVGRARQALHLLGRNPGPASSTDLIIRVLHAALSDKFDSYNDNDGVPMLRHYVAQLLKQIEKSTDTIPESQLVALEWAYYHVLQHSERPPRTLHKALAREPEFFMELLKAAYIPDPESGIIETEPDDVESADRIAHQAWDVLQDWKHIPGTRDDGIIDMHVLEEWTKEVRKLSAEVGRLGVADSRIGSVLASAKPDAEGLWPPLAVRELIENLRSKEVESALKTGVYNLRGVTTRMLNDGGRQEHDLAARYRRWSKTLSFEWHRTAAVLESIAKGYEADGKREDEQVIRRQWL